MRLDSSEPLSTSTRRFGKSHLAQVFLPKKAAQVSRKTTYATVLFDPGTIETRRFYRCPPQMFPSV
jgi:hypothetical protein